MTPRGAAVAEAEREAWKRRELAKAAPLTQEQQRELRRVLLPQSNASRRSCATPA
jgi:hypothetical protein